MPADKIDRTNLHAAIAAVLEGAQPATGPLTREELADIDQAIDILNPLLQRDIRRLIGECLQHRKRIAQEDTEVIEKVPGSALKPACEPANRTAAETALEHG